jgi:hypothetical protein
MQSPGKLFAAGMGNRKRVSYDSVIILLVGIVGEQGGAGGKKNFAGTRFIIRENAFFPAAVRSHRIGAGRRQG